MSIRVHSWFKNTRSEDPAGQFSSWKAPATKIRVHSCSFVVQNNPQRSPFRADLGLESPSYRNSWPFVVQNNTPRKVPAAQISRSKARATKIRVHSWPFVVQNNPQRRPFWADIGLESPSYR
ncbi:MAG: hypothetical protein ACK5YE_10840, partial [Planctomyces sp.]